MIGTIASSRARRGMGYGQARSGALRRVMSRFVELCRGKSWPVLLAFGNHLHGRRGCGFDVARWDVLRFVQERHGSARCDLFLHGESWKPPSFRNGGRSTRPWWDQVSWCAASWCAERRVVSWLASQPHPCRHGSRSTREVWDGLRFVLSRRVDAGLVRASCGGARIGEACQGTKLVQARGRINAGGLGWCKAGYALARLVSARLV